MRIDNLSLPLLQTQYMKLNLLFPFLYITHFFALSPIFDLKELTKTNLTGHWEGTITQDFPDGTRVNYDMEMELTQKGKKVTGVSIVHYQKYAARMSVEGKFHGDLFLKLEEKAILKYDTIPDATWCLKKGELIFRLKEHTQTLEGLWEGKANTDDCIPGRIFLKQKSPRA